MNATRTVWTNTDERVFLDGLGTWGIKSRDRAKLLTNYLAASKLRKKWKPIVRIGAVSYASYLLKIEGRG